MAIEDLIEDPVATVERSARDDGGVVGRSHPAIPLPGALYGAGRRNSSGFDLASESRLASLDAVIDATGKEAWSASPLLGADVAARVAVSLLNPARHDDVVGHVQDATLADVETALACAVAAAPAWAATVPRDRAAMLSRAADLLEDELPRLLGLLSREAGKTYPNGVAEVREAVDFLRFYAGQVEREFDNATHVPLGPIVCISPWNFPLAIFAGQVAAALAAATRCSPSRPSRRRSWPPRWSDCCVAPACRTACSSSCRAAARRWAPRWSPMRACAA